LWNFWWSNNWGTYTIGLWADYGYKITKFENGISKYIWDYDWETVSFDEDWGTYYVALTFGCTGNFITCPGLQEIKLSYRGNPSSLGTPSSRDWSNPGGFDIVSATIYKRTRSVIIDDFYPAGGF